MTRFTLNPRAIAALANIRGAAYLLGHFTR